MRRAMVLIAVMAMLPVGIARASHVETVVAFNPAAGEFPEGIAVDKSGNLFVSLTFLGQIRKIEPDGSQSLLATLAPAGGLGLTGLAVDAPGNVYAGMVSFDPASHGVWRVAGDGSAERLAGSAAIAFPNGLAFDRRGNLYVTDTTAGAVWRIPPGGSAELWFEHALLVGNGSAGFGFPIGANGIAYRNGAIYVSNTEFARIVRIPVEPNGDPGAPQIHAEDPKLLFADGIAFGVHGNLYVAVIAQSTLVRVSPSGDSVTTLATSADGLDFASSLAFGTGMSDRKSLFLVNFAIGPPGGAGPGILRVAVGEPGMPLP